MKVVPVVQCVLLCIGLLCSCRKDPNVNTFQGRGQVVQFDMQQQSVFTPSNGADSVALGADIIINFHQLPGLKHVEMISLQNGGKTVDGKVTLSSTEARFRPFKELEPYTTYTVQARLVAYATPNDTRVVSMTGSNRSGSFTRDTTHQHVSWKFTTRGPYVYTMKRTSQAVTAFARDGNKVMQMGEYLYSYGGWSAVTSHSDIYRSDGDLSVWTQMPDAPWEGRHTYGFGKIDSTLYVFGGDHLSTVFDVWKSDDGLQFTPVQQDLNSVLGPRLLYGACAHDSKLYVMGGQSSLENGYGLTDVWVSSTGTFWKRIASGLEFLGKNISGSVVSFNDRIWVVGGGQYRDDDLSKRFTNHIYSSEDGQTWQREPDAPWQPRQYGDVCVWNDRLWLISGSDGKNLDDIWYMTRDGQWHSIDPPAEYLPRHATGVGVYNDRLVIVCGNYHNDCWVIEKN